MVETAGNREPAADEAWAERLRRRHRERVAAAAAAGKDRPATGADGKIHPRAIFDAIADLADPDYVGGRRRRRSIELCAHRPCASTYMDAGAFGCLGVGVPFAIAAALAMPGRQVISVNGDGAFGINAMEIDTAVRHGAKAVFIVSNNAAWNIERLDQEMNYGGRVVGTTLAPFRLCGDGARARPARRARRGAGRAAPARLQRALAQRAGAGRCRHLADR